MTVEIEYEMTMDIPTWKQSRRLVRLKRDELDKCWNGTIWLNLTQGRHMWKAHPTTGHYGCTMMMTTVTICYT